ncbi:hypothetical protein BDN71DRAFT_1497789 [Pleurotus eryngii]|uniref:Uncharacterized protein n=1 Tax=Pleurotus eryngii TaxID=5323 RepID=A0A9P6DDI8_PLEER|nr:hypothetical protein BDN71DRAFT_1497789 [Pleurotus eryngii]
MPPLQPDYHNLPNEVLRMIFSSLTGTHPCRSEALYNLLFVSRRANAIAQPLFYQHVALYCGSHCRLPADDCQGFRKCLDSLVCGITADGTALGATVQTINLTVPVYTVHYVDERQSGEMLDVLLPHLPNLRKLMAFYISVDKWPVSKLMLLPNPTKLTLLTLNIMHDYPSFLVFLRTCLFLEYLAIDMVQVKNGETPDVIPPDVIPCLRGVYCDSDFLYFCVLAGQHMEHINIMGCDISWMIRNGANLDAIAGPMALARSLSVLGQMYLQYTLQEDDIAPYSHLEFLAVAICDCGGCIPDHDTVAEAFFTAMTSLGILDIEIKPNLGVKACSQDARATFEGVPWRKTTINFVFPSCDNFQDPMWVDSVEDLASAHPDIDLGTSLVEHRLKGLAGEPPL